MFEDEGFANMPSVAGGTASSRAGSPPAPSFIGVLAGWLTLGLVVVLAGCSGSSFVAYTPTTDVVPALTEDSHVFVGGYLGVGNFGDCPAGELLWGSDNPGPNASEWRTLEQVVGDNERSRGLSFLTQRFETRQEFDDQMDRIREWFSEPCVSRGKTEDGSGIPDVDVEPAALPGLPDAAITAHWTSKRWDDWTTVIGDRDQQIMMIVWWREEPEPVPTDSFVDVVNSAWADFESEHSR